MSDRVGIKPKENAGKKFSSLNLNQTYKGTKVEPKTTTGASRHGLQSLGKVAASRRMPPPANLPSLKSENLGNDPTVALVPSGGGGWGSGKEKEASTTTPTVVVPVQNTAQGTTGSSQQQAQQPLKPTEASQKPATTPAQQTSTEQTTTSQTSATSTKTWASSSSVAGGQEKTSYPHQSQYFNQEFPTLGGGNLGDKQLEERASHPPYGQPPRNMHDPPWLDKGGPGPPPQPPFGMYNGAQPRAGYDTHAQHRDGHPPNHPPRPEGSGTFPYMGQSRPPNHTGHPPPQRGHPNSRHGGFVPRHAIPTEDSSSVYARPSILKEDDIRAMDAEDMEDGGWAGAQEEIDYSVKLNFDDDHDEPSGGERNVKNQEELMKTGAHQQNRAGYGDENRAQEANKHPSMRRQAWSGTGRGDSEGNYQQQQQWHHELGRQGPPGYHPQRAWPGAHPTQQRNSFAMGPPSAFPPPGGMHQTDGRRVEHHGSEGPDRPRMKERSSAIEQARQRKEQEELELTRQREAAAREKLKMLDAKPRQLHIQTHEIYTREQAGPRSPLSPAGSDTQVRRIMRRKDSEGATGDDDASVKSVESGGKEEKTDNRKNENQARETRERLRKTSSGDLPEEGKPRLKGIKEERKAPGSPKPTKEKTEEKASIEKDVQSRKTSVEKEPQIKPGKPQRQGADFDTKRSWKAGEESADLKSKVDNKEQEVTQPDRRDVKKRTEDQERRREGPERKSNDNLRRRDEINRKKDQVVDAKKEFPERHKDGYESRKENMDKRADYLDSKNERGSSESLRSRDSLDRRKDDRKRGEDAIKRKRDDFERTEPLNERGNRVHRDRLSSAGRGRGHPGGKSSLRGHPKSYSHARTERTQQRRTSQRTKDFGEEDVKSIPAEEKRQVSDKGDEMRQPDGERRRKDQYQDSRSFGVDKRNERQSKDDRSYKGGSARFPTRPTLDQRTDRAGRFRDKSKNKGGFGVPTCKQPEETKEHARNSRNEERSNAKDEPRTGGVAKPIVSSVDPSKADEKETKTTDVARTGDRSKEEDSNKTDQRKNNERFDYTSPVTNAWAKLERKETTTEVKSDVDSRRNVEQQGNDAASENLQKSAPVASAKDTRRDRKPSGQVPPDRPRDSVETSEGKSSFVKDSKSGENVTKADERRERIESYNGDRKQQGRDRQEQSGDRPKQGVVRREEGGDRRDQGKDRRDQGGDRSKQGGDRVKQGWDRREQDGDRREQGGDGLKQGGDRQEQSGDRREQGGDRTKQGGDLLKQGGDRREQVGDHREQGGNRREQSGDGREQGGDRLKQGGDRLKQQGGDRLRQGGDRREQGGDRRDQGGARRDQGGDRRGQGGDRLKQGGDRPVHETKSNRGLSKGEFRDSKTEERTRSEPRGENRRKFDEQRERAGPRDDLRRESDWKTNDRRPRVENRREQELKTEERRDRTTQRDDVKQRQETKSDQRPYPATQRDDLRQRQEPKSDQRREPTTQRDDLQQRQEPKSDHRREPTTQRDDLQQRQEPKSEHRREPTTQRDDLQQRQEPNSDQGREPTTQRDDLQQRQESKSGERTAPRDEPRQRKDSKNGERRDRVTPRNEPYKRQERKFDEQRERTEPRGEFRNKQEVKHEERDGCIEQQSDSRRGQESKTEERNNGTEQYKASRDEQSVTSKSGDRFTIGLTGSERQGTDRGRFRDSRRGGSRRGGRGGSSRMSRGRGRPGSYGSGRIVGRGSGTVSKDDDDDSDESGKYHSANSLVDEDSDKSDTEVFPKQDSGNKDERSGRSQPSVGGTRQHYTTARTPGRGTGSSPMSSRNQWKPVERPPRFLKQAEQARGASRGRGRTGRGQHTGFNAKENWDGRESEKHYDRSNKNFEEGPSPKKRSPGNLQDPSYPGERSSSGLKSRKPTRNGQGNKSSFLVKKQQEAVEGSRKESSRSSAGPKSSLPAALNQARNERRGKNDSVPDLDDIPEPPKKNPRRAEPTRMGIEHIDLTNIAGFIDIDDIVQPTNETEPASPQSGFVEVKSKRTQKEARERAREDEERKRRETEKMMADAMLKPKAHKQNNSSKSHQTSKPPRFARNNMAPNQIPSVNRVNTPPGTVPPVLSPENSMSVILPATCDQKRTSPLMMEKPSSPAPPPMFNAWTKPLSITPAKPPNVSVEMAMAVRPDPLAVGSGKPMRSNGTQPKSEEPGLQIQLKLPDTFQEMPAERNMESQTTVTPVLIENEEIKKRDVDSDAIATPSRKTDAKIAGRATESSANIEKATAVNEKRQGSNRFTRPPRFEKTTPPMKRNVDARKYKGDNKEQNSEAKSQPSTGDLEKIPKEKSEDRPRSGSRSRELNKNPKSKQQVKAAKPPDTDGAGEQSTDKNSQEKVNGTSDEGHPKLNKRDSGELDVDSMSESLLDEAPLAVRMVETSESASGPPSMDKITTEDDKKMDAEMKEKMVAAKKAWDGSISSSASMAVTSPKWKKSSVSDGDNTESNEVMDQIPRPSSEVEESAEPITSTPSTRLKKPSNGEQQNVCKVKPQQQQPVVKPPSVSSDVPEEFPTSNARTRPRADLQTQTSYPIQPTTVFSSKTTQYPFTFDQPTILPFSQHYVQAANIATVQHPPSIRQQALRPTSQSPPQRNAVFPQGQPMSTPSPLSQQPVLQDTFRPLMQAPLYSTTSYPNSQYFISPVVRQATPQFNDEGSNSVYALPPSKSQAVGHGYEQSVAPSQHVFMSVEQSAYLDHTQPQRQQALGFYPDNTNQASLTSNIPHIQTAMAFPQPDKRVQQHTPDNRPGHHEQQVYPTSGQSEMVKHLNAKPFQPPVNNPTANMTHQMVAPNRHMTAVTGPTSVSPVYQMNSAVVSMHAAGIVSGSSSPSSHSGTTIVTQAHTMPVSRMNYHQYQTPVGSYPRQVQVPVQSLAQPAYATSMAYRTPVPTYPSSSVGNQTGMIVQQKSFPMVRQLMTQGRGPPLTHRVPEPIQRPNKPGGMLSNNPKEKLANQPLRVKSAHLPYAARRGISQIRGVPPPPPPPQMMSYQLQPQQTAPPQQQQQQMFRSQQRQLMLSGAQQFFAENKGTELQHHRKHTPDQQKRELAPASSGDSGQQTNQDRKQPVKTQQETKPEIKPQKSTKKDEPKKPEYKYEKRNNRPQERKDVRTAQIQPQRNQVRSQTTRPKASAPKQEPVKTMEQLSAVEPAKTEQSIEKIESRPELKESQAEVVQTPLV